MGDVISFADFTRARASAPLARTDAGSLAQTVGAAMSSARDTDTALAAARPLLDLCRDRYGFLLMCDGIPTDTAVLSRVLVAIYRGLESLDGAMQAPRTYPSFGLYLGRRRLAWFEDGYSGETGLAVPLTVSAAEFADFVRPRVTARRARSRD